MAKVFSTLALLLSCCAVVFSNAHAEALTTHSKTSVATLAPAIQIEHCPQQKRWKIAVLQSGSYPDFQKLFYFMTRQLMHDKIMRMDTDFYNNFDVHKRPFKFDEGRNYIEMARRSKGGCIEFVEDGFFNALWDQNLAHLQKNRIRHMIAQRKIDMIWTFGTIGGLTLADSSLGVPVVVIDATAPAASGFIAKGEYSNKPGIHVQKEVKRYESELVMFHKLFHFKRLGLLLDISEEDQFAQAFPLIQRVAQEQGFELEPCYGVLMGQNNNESAQDFKNCMTHFATADIDAFLLTVGYRPRTGLYNYLKPLIDRQIPIYSQAGENDVRHGALLSLSDSDMSQSAFFEVNVIKRILHGEAVDKISQFYMAPLKLTLNLKTARLIEWKPTFEMLVAVDHVVRTIENEDL